MTRFAAIDYSALPLPAAIEAWGFQAIKDARKADFLARWAQKRIADPTLPMYDVASLESDPAIILIETDTDREGLVRQRINDAVRATYLSKADQWDDVVARAAEYMTSPAPGETIESLRARAQQSWEALSIGGSYGGYAYRARSVAPVDIADVSVIGYEASQPDIYGAHAILDFPKGEVRIALLGAAASGIVPASVLTSVRALLADRTTRKVNDFVNVVQATIRPYVVDATLILKRGVAPAAVVEAAKTRAKAYAAAAKMIGVEATRGGFQAALMNAEPGLVVDVDLHSPSTAIGGRPLDAPVATGFSVDWRYVA